MTQTMSNFSNWIALVALVVSAASVLFTIFWNSPIGAVGPLEPSGYAIIRGLPAESGIGPFPSDHLVLPTQWKNASGRPVVVQRPELTLRRVQEHKETGEKVETGETIAFSLAGEYPDISTESVSKRYIHNNSFLVEPHSVSLRTLVFHHEGYWESSGRHFKFTAYCEYRVYVTYTKNSGLGRAWQKLLVWTKLFKSYADGKKTETLADSLKMHGKVNKLVEGRGPEQKEAWWDYWGDITFETPSDVSTPDAC